MAIKPESVTSSEPGGSVYTCPGCGEKVDSRQMDQVLVHHQHVIVPAAFPPAWFQRTPDGTRSVAVLNHQEAGRGERTGAGQTSAVSAEARLRRYGH